MTNRTGFATMAASLGGYATLAFVIEQIMNGMATATVAEVIAVSGDTVNIKPLVNQIDGQGTGIPHGIIHNVPFFALIGGGSAVTVKPVAGDKGLVVFCHNDISSVKTNKKASNPGSWRRYSMADAIYLGGLPMLNAAPTTFITVADAGITITSPNNVTINANVTINGDLTSTGTVTGQADVIGGGTSLHAHKHGGVQTGTNQTGAPV